MNAPNVISLVEVRAKKRPDPRNLVWSPTDPILSRAFLYAGIDDDGNCKFDVGTVERHDIPAMLTMMHVMSLKLTKLLNEASE